jgi:Multiubiquitin
MSETHQEQVKEGPGGGNGHGGHPKRTKIVVNGRERTVEGDEISYEEVVPVGLDPVPTGPNVLITVTYSDARGPNKSGTLTPGQSVEIRNGTRFNVVATDKS